MKSYLNEKGSFPLVVLVAFIVLLSISSLTGLLLSEKMNIRFSIDKDLKRIYEKESMIELTKNITNQLILSKEWELIEDEDVLNSVDLVRIEEIVNEETLSLMDIDGYVHVKEASTDFKVDDYCQRIEDEDGEFLTYDCLKDTFTISLDVTIEREGEWDAFQLLFEGFVFLVDDTKHTITIQKE